VRQRFYGRTSLNRPGESPSYLRITCGDPYLINCRHPMSDQVVAFLSFSVRDASDLGSGETYFFTHFFLFLLHW
jgi:hypothetical protein